MKYKAADFEAGGNPNDAIASKSNYDKQLGH